MAPQLILLPLKTLNSGIEYPFDIAFVIYHPIWLLILIHLLVFHVPQLKLSIKQPHSTYLLALLFLSDQA